MTAALLACAVLMFGLAIFQVHRRGGFGWLFGRRKNISHMNAKNQEFIDLQPKH